MRRKGERGETRSETATEQIEKEVSRKKGLETESDKHVIGCDKSKGRRTKRKG